MKITGIHTFLTILSDVLNDLFFTFTTLTMTIAKTERNPTTNRRPKNPINATRNRFGQHIMSVMKLYVVKYMVNVFIKDKLR